MEIHSSDTLLREKFKWIVSLIVHNFHLICGSSMIIRKVCQTTRRRGLARIRDGKRRWKSAVIFVEYDCDVTCARESASPSVGIISRIRELSLYQPGAPYQPRICHRARVSRDRFTTWLPESQTRLSVTIRDAAGPNPLPPRVVSQRV